MSNAGGPHVAQHLARAYVAIGLCARRESRCPSSRTSKCWRKSLRARLAETSASGSWYDAFACTSLLLSAVFRADPALIRRCVRSRSSRLKSSRVCCACCCLSSNAARCLFAAERLVSILRLSCSDKRRRSNSLLFSRVQYKGVESAPRPSAFARFTKKAPKQGARTGKTFGKGIIIVLTVAMRNDHGSHSPCTSNAAATAPEPTPAPEDAAPAVNTISFPVRGRN